MNDYNITVSLIETSLASNEEVLVFNNRDKSSSKRVTDLENGISEGHRSDKRRSRSLICPNKPIFLKTTPKFVGPDDQIEQTLINMMQKGSDFEDSWKVLSDNKFIAD